MTIDAETHETGYDSVDPLLAVNHKPSLPSFFSDKHGTFGSYMGSPSLKGILPDKAVQVIDQLNAAISTLRTQFSALSSKPLLTKPQGDAAYGPATQVKALQVSGSNPLNVTGLIGKLSQTQLAGIPSFTSIPTSGTYSQPGTLIYVNGILTIVSGPGAGSSAGAEAKTINGAVVPLSAIVTATNASRQVVLAVLASAKFWLGNGSGAVAAVSMSGDATMDNAGAVTVAQASGNFSIITAGDGLQIKAGSNARIGTGTLVGGTLLVGNTSVTANTVIFLTDQGGGVLANLGSLYVSARVNGTSFTVSSTNALDTSNFAYFLVESI